MYFNSHLHGITADRVAKSPSLHDIKDELRRQLHDRVVVSHGSFDRGALGHILSDVQWIDSQKIVRRAYPERYRTSGYNLKNLAHDFELTFHYHDAQADARATADILLHIMNDTQTTIDEWMHRVDQQITQSPKHDIRRDGVNEGPLSGHTVVQN